MLQLIPGGFLKAVVEDTAPVLGGNLDADGNNISNVGTLGAGKTKITDVGGDTTSLEIDSTGSALNFAPGFLVKLPAAGLRKGFQIVNGADTYAWAAFEHSAGGANKPGFALGAGGASPRDTNLYRDALNTLASDDYLLLKAGSDKGALRIQRTATAEDVWSGIQFKTSDNETTGYFKSGIFAVDNGLAGARNDLYLCIDNNPDVANVAPTDVIQKVHASGIEVIGRVQSSVMTITASSDDLDVSGVNTVLINPAAAVVIGGLKGGVAGQHLYIQVIDDDQDVTLEHIEGVGTQDIYMHQSLDETLGSMYGGWILVCDGSIWYDCGHARHV